MSQLLKVPLAEKQWGKRVLLSIFKQFPPSDVIFKDPSPRPSVEYEDEVHNPFGRWFATGPKMFAERDVLDLGCGFGGRAVRFSEIGARRVTGIEISEKLVSRAAEFAHSRRVDNVKFWLVRVNTFQQPIINLIW